MTIEHYTSERFKRAAYMKKFLESAFDQYGNTLTTQMLVSLLQQAITDNQELIPDIQLGLTNSLDTRIQLPEGIFTGGDITFNTHTKQVSKEGRTIRLSKKQFIFFHALISSSGAVWSPIQLCELSGYIGITNHDAHYLSKFTIHSIRKKLEDHEIDPKNNPGIYKYIQSYRFEGYAFQPYDLSTMKPIPLRPNL